MNKTIRDKLISILKLVIDSDKLKLVKLYRIKIPEQLIMCCYSLKSCKILICSLKTRKILAKIDMMIMIKYGYYTNGYYSTHGYYDSKHWVLLFKAWVLCKAWVLYEIREL